jgi:hypothetical protein
LDALQAEILAANPASKVRIVGVNQDGQQAANDLATLNRTLPWLQDVAGAAWDGWSVEWRDVVLLDSRNRKREVVNLTDHDLNDPAEYAALKALLLSVAGE